MFEKSTTGEPIRSEFADDPEMAELIDFFVAELPDRIDAIKQSMEGAQLDELERLAHQLKGAGGGYGFTSVSQAAARVEQAVRERAEADAMRADVDALIDVCGRIVR